VKTNKSDPIQDLEKELTRLGLNEDVGVSRQRFRWLPDGSREWYDHPTEVDIALDDFYIRGHPKSLLQFLRKFRKKVDWLDVMEKAKKARIWAGSYEEDDPEVDDE
jgi:hypothetical protein